MGFVSWGTVRVGLLLVLTLPFSTGDTDPRDGKVLKYLSSCLHHFFFFVFGGGGT